MRARAIRVWLADIREEISGIRELTREASRETFAASWAMKRAVQHALLIIAEAAKHIPPEAKAARPEVPWRKIHGLGNLLRHEYRRIDPDILWSVIVDHLEDLDQATAALLESHQE
jgi:uncharacterized protein with HEPN domain